MLINKDYVIRGFHRLADLCDENGDSNTACLARQIATRAGDIPDKAFTYEPMPAPSNEPDPAPVVEVQAEPEATIAQEAHAEPAPEPIADASAAEMPAA